MRRRDRRERLGFLDALATAGLCLLFALVWSAVCAIASVLFVIAHLAGLL